MFPDKEPIPMNDTYHRVREECKALFDCGTLDGFGNAATLEADDTPRLQSQLDAVREIMLDGQWRTLGALAAEARATTGRRATEASVSARLRDLRKSKFGGHTVLPMAAEGGLCYE